MKARHYVDTFENFKHFLLPKISIVFITLDPANLSLSALDVSTYPESPYFFGTRSTDTEFLEN
jgi:hypothetical protein